MTQIGSVIDGKYEILTEIGRGGMSVVYLAMDKRLNKQWAVKEVRKKGVSKNDEIVVNSLMAEANLIKRLDHSAFPRIVDIIDNGQTIYIVMDYIEGESLDKVLEERGAQSEDNVIHWAMQICDALSYLHNQKPHPIIYRDMKPANLMLKPEGEYGIIKIIDFGIAREFKDKNLADTTVLGTRGYASPEHYTGNTDIRSDIFCLGMTMHHLLTGVDPRKGDQYAPVRNWNPELSEGIEIIVDKCVQPAPENRYQNCDELLRDLYDPSKLTHDYRKRQKRKLGAFLAAFLMSALMLIAGFVLRDTSYRIDNNDYESLIGVEPSTPYATKVEGYKRAIEIYPDDLRAYTKLLEAYEDNGRFSATESSEFLYFYNKNPSLFKLDNPEVCEFRFKLGTMYLNYYTEANGSESVGARTSLAHSYFENNYFENDEDPENRRKSTIDYEHKTISDCLYHVCDFYKEYLLESGSGKLNVKEPDREDYEIVLRTITDCINSIQDEGAYNKLTLYSFTFNLLHNNSNNMAELGVSKSEVLALFDDVSNRAVELTVHKTQAKEMRDIIESHKEDYRKSIEAAYDASVKYGTDERGEVDDG